ncbi:MAG: hypothetical protein ACI4J6_01990 [Oscillospiraceae bacterium]
MDKYAELISKLEELCCWLDKNSSPYSDDVRKIICELQDEDMNEYRRNRIRHELSGEILFHPKCLGDVYIKDFPKDGTNYPWHNYLYAICSLAQEALKE